MAEDGALRLLCVRTPIAEVAQSIPTGPWVAHVSGATPLAELAPHVNRFSVHPLQTLTRSEGPSSSTAPGRRSPVSPRKRSARARAGTALGLRPFVLADDRRALYHAGAAMASNFLVTLHRAASRLLVEQTRHPRRCSR